MRVKLTSTLGAPVVKLIDDNATIADLAVEAGKAFSIPLPNVRIASGVPLKEISASANGDACSAHGIKNGVVVDVRRSADIQAVVPALASVPILPPVAAPQPALAYSPSGAWSCSACTFSNENPAAVGCEMCGTERPPQLTRQIVPADNTCLFTAVGYLLSERRLLDRGPAYRSMVSDAIRSSSAELGLTEADLGKPASEYAAYISGKDTWGGGLELAVLAKLKACEMCAIEVRTGRPYVFGEGKGYTSRVYLVFDGVHYDAVHRVDVDGRVTTVFSPEDEGAKQSALELVMKMKAANDFVDLAGFTLRCGVCSSGIRGEAEAVVHARSTGHQNFTEYR